MLTNNDCLGPSKLLSCINIYFTNYSLQSLH